MMAKPVRALELHYPMIQFLIQLDIFLRSECFMRFLAKKKKNTKTSEGFMAPYQL